MELVITAPTADGFIKAIEWNHEEIKQEITEKVALYNSLVYDDNQIKDAKADRAELNKFKKALEDKRKEIKAQCLAPYENFEKQMKELTAIIDEPIKVIDEQVKAFEERQKAEKEAAVKEYFNTKDFQGFTFEQIADAKWLNATTSMKSIQEAIDKIAGEIEADIQIIEDLPEYSFEALQTYKATRDVRQALAEAKRRTEEAKAKAEFEARKAEEEARKAEEAEARAAEVEEVPAEVEVIENIPESVAESSQEDAGFCPNFDELPNTREWKAYKVFATPEDIEALEWFLNSRSVPFERL